MTHIQCLLVSKRLTCPRHMRPFCQGDNQTKRVMCACSLTPFVSDRCCFQVSIFQFVFASLTWFLDVQPFYFPIKPCPLQHRLSLIENATICASYRYPTTADKEMADLQKEEGGDFKFKLRRWMGSHAIYSWQQEKWSGTWEAMKFFNRQFLSSFSVS